MQNSHVTLHGVVFRVYHPVNRERFRVVHILCNFCVRKGEIRTCICVCLYLDRRIDRFSLILLPEIRCIGMGKRKFLPLSRCNHRTLWRPLHLRAEGEGQHCLSLPLPGEAPALHCSIRPRRILCFRPWLVSSSDTAEGTASSQLWARRSAGEALAGGSALCWCLL